MDVKNLKDTNYYKMFNMARKGQKRIELEFSRINHRE